MTTLAGRFQTNNIAAGAARQSVLASIYDRYGCRYVRYSCATSWRQANGKGVDDWRLFRSYDWAGAVDPYLDDLEAVAASRPGLVILVDSLKTPEWASDTTAVGGQCAALGLDNALGSVDDWPAQGGNGTTINPNVTGTGASRDGARNPTSTNIAGLNYYGVWIWDLLDRIRQRCPSVRKVIVEGLNEPDLTNQFVGGTDPGWTKRGKIVNVERLVVDAFNARFRTSHQVAISGLASQTATDAATWGAYLDAIKAAAPAGTQPCAWATFHTYTTPSSMLAQITSYRSELRRRGWTPLIWLTECGHSWLPAMQSTAGFNHAGYRVVDTPSLAALERVGQYWRDTWVKWDSDPANAPDLFSPQWYEGAPDYTSKFSTNALGLLSGTTFVPIEELVGPVTRYRLDGARGVP